MSQEDGANSEAKSGVSVVEDGSARSETNDVSNSQESSRHRRHPCSSAKHKEWWGEQQDNTNNNIISLTRSKSRAVARVVSFLMTTTS